MKLLSPDKVRTHNQRSVLNRCLGVDLFVQPDIFQVPVQDGDCIILCTDGVWSVIEDEEFAKFAAEELDPEKLNQKVFELAMKRDSDDNLSVMSLRLQRLLPSPPGAGDSRWNRLLQRFKRRGDLNV
jgi:protein phosphatase